VLIGVFFCPQLIITFKGVKSIFKTVAVLSIVPQLLLVKWLGNHPDLVEAYYSEGVYPYIAKFLRSLFGWIPFSIGDVFYTLLGFAILRYCVVNRYNFRERPRKIIMDLGLLLSVTYFIFHLLWGMNYYRLPIEHKLQIQRSYTVKDLEIFTQKLVVKTNALQEHITKDSAKAVHLLQTKTQIFKDTPISYKYASTDFPFLTYKKTSLKKSLYSLPLTYMGYGGYFNPFTGEAQVNGKIPILRYPTVSAHEVGHQLGYSAEDATNFIGFLVTSKSKDIHYSYASYSHMLAYCLSDLRARDEKTFQKLWEQLNAGIKKNYEELNTFWEAYENPTEPIFKEIFNTFLKANSQEEGILSYNSVVGLLINYDKKYGY